MYGNFLYPLTFLLLFGCCLVGSVSFAQSLTLRDVVPELLDSFYVAYADTGSLEDDRQILKRLREKIDQLGQYNLSIEILELIDKYEVDQRIDSAFLRSNYANTNYYVFVKLRNIPLAKKYYLKAYQYGGDKVYRHHSWYIENNLAIIFNSLGDHESSEYFYQTTLNSLQYEFENMLSRKDRKSANRSLYGRGLNGLGYLYFWNEEYTKSKKTLMTALDICRDVPTYFGQSKALSYLITLSLQEQDYSAAAAYSHELDQIFDSIPSAEQYNTRLDHLSSKAKIASETNRTKDALRLWKEYAIHYASVKNPQHPRYLSACYVNMVHLYLKNNKVDKARKYLTKAAQALDINFETALIASDTSYGEIKIAELYESAVRYFQNMYEASHEAKFLDSALYALDIIDLTFKSLRREYAFDDSKRLNIKSNRNVFEQRIDIYAQLLKLNNEHSNFILNQLAETFTASKNILLTETELISSIVRRMNEKQRNVYYNLSDSLTELSLNREHKSTRFEAVDQQRPFALKLQKLLQDHMIDFEETKEQRQGYFIDFVQTDSTVYSLDNFSGKLAFKDLGSSKGMLQKIRRVYTIMDIDSLEGNYSKILTSLYHHLFGNSKILPKTFTIFPDGALNYIPFAALINSNGDYLVEAHDISIGFSSSTTNMSDQEHENIFIVKPKYKSPVLLSSVERGELWKLAYADEEANEISKHSPDDTYIKEELSKKDFLSLMKQDASIHFVGHAVSQGDLSFLALSSDTISFLYESEIAKARSNINLIVLSACETGLGQLDQGEGLRSLSRSFLLGGTRAVLYNIWRANDHSAYKLMNSFYTNKFNGMTNISALAQAQREYLEQASPKLRHPYYWAGFQITDSASGIKTTWKRSHYLFLFTLLIISCIFFFKFRKS